MIAYLHFPVYRGLLIVEIEIRGLAKEITVGTVIQRIVIVLF